MFYEMGIVSRYKNKKGMGKRVFRAFAVFRQKDNVTFGLHGWHHRTERCDMTMALKIITAIFR